jgi:hypothetical protein
MTDWERKLAKERRALEVLQKAAAQILAKAEEADVLPPENQQQEPAIDCQINEVVQAKSVEEGNNILDTPRPGAQDGL